MTSASPLLSTRPARSHPHWESETPVVLDARVVTGSGGGPDKTILNSPRFLDQAGYRMLCAYMHPPGDPGLDALRQRARQWGAPLLSVPDRGALDWRVAAGLLKVCKQERVAIWHAHDYKSDLLGLLLKPFWPMRLVTTVHGWGVAGTRPLYNRIDRLCLPRYERVLCVSDDIRLQCVRCGVPQDRCLLVENGIDTGQFVRSRPSASAKEELGIRADRLVVGAVGRLSKEKGFDQLVLSVDQLVSQGLDLELWIGGEGPERPSLEALVQRLGLDGRVHLPGFVPDPVGLYEAMDVLALSSLSEGLPNVLLEAMALEVPVVATRIAGIPRLVTDGENGLLVEPGSVQALAQTLGSLLRNPALRRSLGSEGRRTIERRYSFSKRMRLIRTLYDDLLGRPSAQAPAPAPGVS